MSQIRDAVGLDEPDKEDELLGPAIVAPATTTGDEPPADKPPARLVKDKTANAARFDSLRQALNAGGATAAARVAKAAQARKQMNVGSNP